MFACGLVAGAEQKLGKPLTLAQPTPISEISAHPAQYTGKTVLVRGKVTEVCEMAGCWMKLVDGGQSLRVRVNDGDIVFPKTAIGKIALAEGKLVEIKLTREQAVARARHEAEEQKRPFRAESIKSGMTIYQIQGTGAVVSE